MSGHICSAPLTMSTRPGTGFATCATGLSTGSTRSSSGSTTGWAPTIHSRPVCIWSATASQLAARLVSESFDYDAELRLHNELFRAAARVGSRDRVLDIGCGTGLSTREAARAAVTGSAVGVDVSAPMLERARKLSADEGLANITFEQADA